MNSGLYSGVSAVQSNERRLDAITSNLANIETPGYKRRASSAFGILVADGSAEPHHHVGTVYSVDYSQGPLERTGNPLDVALMGKGFFAVEGPRGEVYTRRGSLRTDAAGVLTTEEGYPVAWEQARGQLDPVGEAVTIDGAGTVFQGASEVGRLKVVGFEATDRLQIDANGYFYAGPELRRTPSDAEVHQFALERSNVSSVDELVSLITVQRNFESATKLMQLLDESYRRLNASR